MHPYEPLTIRSIHVDRLLTFVTRPAIDLIQQQIQDPAPERLLPLLGAAVLRPRGGFGDPYTHVRHNAQQAYIEVMLYFAHTLSREDFADLARRLFQDAVDTCIDGGAFFRNNEIARFFLSYLAHQEGREVVERIFDDSPRFHDIRPAGITHEVYRNRIIDLLCGQLHLNILEQEQLCLQRGAEGYVLPPEPEAQPRPVHEFFGDSESDDENNNDDEDNDRRRDDGFVF